MKKRYFFLFMLLSINSQLFSQQNLQDIISKPENTIDLMGTPKSSFWNWDTIWAVTASNGILIRSYDNSGKVTELYSSFNGIRKTVYSYDPNDRIVSESTKKFNPDNGQWDKEIKHEYIYNTNGSINTELFYKGDSLNYNYDKKYVYSYNTNQQKINKNVYYWYNNAWDFNEIDSFSYYNSGKIKEEKYYQYYLGFQFWYKVLYNYDNNENLKKWVYSSYDTYDDSFVYRKTFYYNTDSTLSKVFYENFNACTNTIIPDSLMITYTYDNQHNLIKKTYRIDDISGHTTDNNFSYTYDSYGNSVQGIRTWVTSKIITDDSLNFKIYSNHQNIYNFEIYPVSYKASFRSFTTVNIVNNQADTPIKIYPNPASNTLIISNLKKLSEISIYDINGKILIMQNATEHPQIDVSRLVKGMYFIRIKDENGVMSTKFVKE